MRQMSLEHPGGDTRTPGAKQTTARREEQIVALKLRHHSYSAIARVVGISRQSAQKAFLRALHRNTAADIQTHHRSELAELDAQQAKLWTVVDNPKVSEKNLIAAINATNRIHIRRAHLLGLDAPTKLDVSGIYRIGTDELSEERRETERAWRSLPVEEQMRIYDAFDAARTRLNAPIETTATVTSGPAYRA
jgi:DNA-binding CsgD family transcriptional regulator